MATAHEHFVKAERLAAQSYGQETEHAAYTVQLALVHATLAHAAALGANEKPLPSLDDYCLCPTELRAETFTHAADCPHAKPANDEGPAASPTEPSA